MLPRAFQEWIFYQMKLRIKPKINELVWRKYHIYKSNLYKEKKNNREKEKKDLTLTTITAPAIERRIPIRSWILNFSFNTNGAMIALVTRATVPNGATIDGGANA